MTILPAEVLFQRTRTAPRTSKGDAIEITPDKPVHRDKKNQIMETFKKQAFQVLEKRFEEVKPFPAPFLEPSLLLRPRRLPPRPPAPPKTHSNAS